MYKYEAFVVDTPLRFIVAWETCLQVGRHYSSPTSRTVSFIVLRFNLSNAQWPH